MAIDVKVDIDKDTDINELVRFLLLKRKMTIAELARQMTSLSGIEYSRFNIRAKIERQSLRFNEMVLICEILWYKFDLKEIV